MVSDELCHLSKACVPVLVFKFSFYLLRVSSPKANVTNAII